MHRAKYGEGAWGFHTLSEQDTLPNLQVFTSPGVLKTLPFWVFMEASLLRHDGWNHWQCNWLNLQSPSPFQRSGGETESSKPLITWLILQANSPHPFVVVFQSFSHVRLFATPWTTALQASLSFTISQSCSNSCPLSQWCHPTILSSVVPFSSCLQSFPPSRSFPMSQLFASGGQSVGASASVLPMTKFRVDFL